MPRLFSGSVTLLRLSFAELSLLNAIVFMSVPDLRSSFPAGILFA